MCRVIYYYDRKWHQFIDRVKRHKVAKVNAIVEMKETMPNETRKTTTTKKLVMKNERRRIKWNEIKQNKAKQSKTKTCNGKPEPNEEEKLWTNRKQDKKWYPNHKKVEI